MHLAAHLAAIIAVLSTGVGYATDAAAPGNNPPLEYWDR
jgi:hypothetical protein